MVDLCTYVVLEWWLVEDGGWWTFMALKWRLVEDGSWGTLVALSGGG